MLNIVIIGTGNAATVLGKKLCAAGHQIIQLYGRNKENAQKLAGLLKSVPVSEWTEILTTADIYLLAVADDVIEEVRRLWRVGRVEFPLALEHVGYWRTIQPPAKTEGI